MRKTASRLRSYLAVLLAAAAVAALPLEARGDEPGMAVESTLRRALASMGTRQWTGGWGYAWSKDGRVMWGEWLPIDTHGITVQPPATPSIGRVYVRAARWFDDPGYLQHARLARDALLRVQSLDGGFPQDAFPLGERPGQGSFDDGCTTTALDFLLDLWLYTGEEEDRQAALSVAKFLLVSQYPNGGWPQWYPPKPGHYQACITFNDGVMANCIQAALRLHEVFGDQKYLDAALRAGDCIIALQGGPGEAAWAQQHDPEALEPAQARLFEPAGYTPAESIAVCDVLLDLYLATGEERFLAPLPEAFAWYDAAKLPNGKWARLYEPGTGRPVYGGSRSERKNVYDVAEATGGYGWQGNWYPTAARKLYGRIQKEGRDAILKEREAARKKPPGLDAVGEVCAALSPEGWWLKASDDEALTKAGVPKEERYVIQSGTFCRNANLLIDYLELPHGHETRGDDL